jgi:hypothetical protein
LADFDEALVDFPLGRPSLIVLVATRIFPDYFPQSEAFTAIAEVKDITGPVTWI